MYNNSSNENNETLSNNEMRQKYEESKIIFNSITNSNGFMEYDDLFSLEKNNKYYLINRNWCLKFKKYCNTNEDFADFNYPGKIDNNNLIIVDNSSLKTKSDTRIYFNNEIDFDRSCIFIKKEFWLKLKNIFGGGPEYEIIYHHDKYTNLIKEGGHINLLFIPNKKNIMKNTSNNSLRSNNYIPCQYFYFNLQRKVSNLRTYINNLLNNYKSKFSIKNKETLKEDKHYRLWLYSSFIGTPIDLANYLSKRITNYINNEKNSKYSLIDWTNLTLTKNDSFKMNLLSNFDENEIKDIFPNRHSKVFEYEDYKKRRKEDKYHLPEFIIIIEQEPYQFITDNKIYKIGICNKCKFTEIVYCACECKNLFFCCQRCQEIYYQKYSDHHSKCKIYLKKYYKDENKKMSKNTNSIYSLIGLLNLGNTCYMNSALQCMRSIKELNDYFLNYFDESQLNINNAIGTGGFITMAYVNLIYNLNNCKDDYFKPEYFKNTIGLIDDRYSDYSQQDTHEFLTFLIDSIHEDLNKVKNKPIIQRKDSEITNYYSSEMEDTKSLVEWNNFLKTNQSIIVDLFYGQYKTTISCPCCHHKSINFSIYLSLQLPIPKYLESFMIKVIFNEEGPNSFPSIKMNIILNRINNKILDIKKMIGKIFEISPYEIEIVKYKNKEIIKVYDDEEKINEYYNTFYAIKINLIGKNTDIDYENKINYSSLKEDIINKKDKIIKIFQNNNNNDIKDNDDKININKTIYDKNCMEKFIIKHYYLLDKEISTDIFNKDYLIYLPTNKTCSDIYYEIFKIYFEIIIINYLKESSDNHKYNDKKYEELFKQFFKNFIDYDKEFKNDIFEEDSENKSLPFILKLGDISNKKSEYIPPLTNYDFKDFIDNMYMRNNKNNNSKDLEDISNFNDLNIENGNDGDRVGNINNITTFENNNLQHIGNKSNNNNNSSRPFRVVKQNNNSKSLDNKTNTKTQEEISITINITKDKEDKLDESKNIKCILIIFNPKFLRNNEANKNYYLADKSSEDIDLTPFFQTIYDNNFRKIYIDKCFEEFSKEETFDKDNLWKCSKCQQNIPATNKMEIYQTPKILIIQLKRFKNNQKIESFIDFPLKDLDMNKYVSSSVLKNSNNIPNKYDLFAVANHYGRLEYGHYDAFCLNYIDHNWYNFNDRFVKKIDKEDEKNDIVTQNAYVLFYRQQDNDLINWDKIYNKQFFEINDHNMKLYGQDFVYKDGIQINIKNNQKNDIQGLNWDEIFNKNKINFNNIKKMDLEDNEESHSFDDLSLGSFVYDPFKKNYLRLKRHLNRK